MATRRVPKKQLQDFRATLAAIHKEAKAKGLDKMTMREINAEIAEVRREKDPLYGQVRRIGVTVSERMYRQVKAAVEVEGGGIGVFVRQAIGERLQKGIAEQPSAKTAEQLKIASVQKTKKPR